MTKLIGIVLFSVIANSLAAPPAATLKKEEYGDKLASMTDKLHNNCRDKSGTDEAHIQRLIEGHLDEDIGMKKYYLCVFQDTGAVTPEGELDFEVINSLAPPAIKDSAPPLMVKCISKYLDMSVLDKIYNMQRCVFKESTKDYIAF